MKFWKYHGLGNDFLVIDNLDGSISLDIGTVIAMCHRRFGIGADGVLLVEKSSIADAKMTIINSDGSIAEMCGNGVRCFAKYVYDHNIARSSQIAVETGAGVLDINVRTEGGKAVAATVNMGKPDFEPGKFSSYKDGAEIINIPITVEDKTFYITSLLMGVPHTVIFTESIDDEFIMYYGKLIERHSMFPKGTNVNFVKLVSRDSIMIRTWERGAGYTYACGTGACACVVAGITQGLLDDKVKAQLRGGDLLITWKDRQDVYMEGPAAEICEGFYSNCIK